MATNTVTFTIDRDLLAETWLALRDRQVILQKEVATHEMDTVRAIAYEQLQRVDASLAALGAALNLG